MNMNISKCISDNAKDAIQAIPEEGMISKYLMYAQVIKSKTARDNNISNNPTSEHLENLRSLGYNVYDKIYEHFNGKITTTSIYRSSALNKRVGGSSTSQHLKGEAMDIQGIAPVTNKDIFKYVMENLVYHQIIWEYGTDKNPNWVHVSYKKKCIRK